MSDNHSQVKVAAEASLASLAERVKILRMECEESYGTSEESDSKQETTPDPRSQPKAMGKSMRARKERPQPIAPPPTPRLMDSIDELFNEMDSTDKILDKMINDAEQMGQYVERMGKYRDHWVTLGQLNDRADVLLLELFVKLLDKEYVDKCDSAGLENLINRKNVSGDNSRNSEGAKPN